MAFIVSLVKYIVLTFCFVLLVGLVFGLLWAGDNGVFSSPENAIGIIVAVVVGMMSFVLYLGIVAIFLSIHDRHREIAEGVHRIADELQRINSGGTAL